MSIQDFLSWLLGAGGSVMAASWILERIPWFQAKAPDVKEWIFFAVSAVISLGAYLVVTFVPIEIINAIAPYFAILAGLFSTVILGKIFHEVDKR